MRLSVAFVAAAIAAGSAFAHTVTPVPNKCTEDNEGQCCVCPTSEDQCKGFSVDGSVPLENGYHYLPKGRKYQVKANNKSICDIDLTQDDKISATLLNNFFGAGFTKPGKDNSLDETDLSKLVGSFLGDKGFGQSPIEKDDVLLFLPQHAGGLAGDQNGYGPLSSGGPTRGPVRYGKGSNRSRGKNGFKGNPDDSDNSGSDDSDDDSDNSGSDNSDDDSDNSGSGSPDDDSDNSDSDRGRSQGRYGSNSRITETSHDNQTKDGKSLGWKNGYKIGGQSGATIAGQYAKKQGQLDQNSKTWDAEHATKYANDNSGSAFKTDGDSFAGRFFKNKSNGDAKKWNSGYLQSVSGSDNSEEGAGDIGYDSNGKFRAQGGIQKSKNDFNRVEGAYNNGNNEENHWGTVGGVIEGSEDGINGAYGQSSGEENHGEKHTGKVRYTSSNSKDQSVGGAIGYGEDGTSVNGAIAGSQQGSSSLNAESNNSQYRNGRYKKQGTVFTPNGDASFSSSGYSSQSHQDSKKVQAQTSYTQNGVQRIINPENQSDNDNDDDDDF